MAHVSANPAPASHRSPEVPPESDSSWLAIRIFQLPGNMIANLIGATEEDDRMAIRVLIDMLFWNVVVVALAVVAYALFG